MRQRSTVLLCACLLAGCYLSHERPPDLAERDADAFDAATPGDAGPDSDADVGSDGGVDAPDGCAGTACGDVAELDGLRWELPCEGPTDRPDVCETRAALREATELEGPPGAIYRVTLRLRGVVETKAYEGGRSDGRINEGGVPDDTNWNLYALDISQPPRRLFLNQGPPSVFEVVALDETVEVEIAVGGAVTLIAEVFDERQIPNLGPDGEPLVVGVGDEPFDGQFIQMDVVAVVRSR